MKIPIIYIPKTRFKRFLIIEKRFKSNKEIIPIGCDCHPAYTLQKLNLRKQSLPFDWLNTNPILGLSFVLNNIQTDFSGFLKGLSKNERGHVVSAEYPYAEFMHEKNLIDNSQDREKFTRRIDRFQKLKDKDCYYLYNTTSSSLKSERQVIELYNSTVEFVSQINKKQMLCIYIRYDETLLENQKNCEMLLDLLGKIEKVKAVNYVREKDKEGIWGNENTYPTLYKSLGIKLRKTVPKMYVK